MVDIMIVLDRGIMIIVIILALVNILLAALNIEILSIIIMELILHNPFRHITLIVDHLARDKYRNQTYSFHKDNDMFVGEIP